MIDYKLVTENQWLHLADLDFTEFKFVEKVINCRQYVLALDNNSIVGVLSFVEHSMWMPNGIGIGKIQVHRNYRNQGICTGLVHILFEFANTYWDGIVVSPYEPDGEKWLKHIIARYSKQYPDLKILEREY